MKIADAHGGILQVATAYLPRLLGVVHGSTLLSVHRANEPSQSRGTNSLLFFSIGSGVDTFSPSLSFAMVLPSSVQGLRG